MLSTTSPARSGPCRYTFHQYAAFLDAECAALAKPQITNAEAQQAGLLYRRSAPQWYGINRQLIKHGSHFQLVAIAQQGQFEVTSCCRSAYQWR